jgi:putative FmdB family regulatory protein
MEVRAGMPIYEYRCTRCGRTIEAIQKLSDPPLAQCETCSGPLEKLVSRTSFQLKGTGWYATGYGSGKSASSSDKSADQSDSGDRKDKKETKAEDGKALVGKGGCSSGNCG